MFSLGIILARAGSKGLPNKCVIPLLRRPMIAYTIDHAIRARRLNDVVLSSDSAEAIRVARSHGIRVIVRPAHLAADEAPVDAAARHAVETYEQQHGREVNIVVLLYANIPIRARAIIDRCVAHLIETECDSVRTVAPVSKQHPSWLHRLNDGRMEEYSGNDIHRRQDLEPLFYHDGAVIALTRRSLFCDQSHDRDFHAMFGDDRRAIIQGALDAVDVDTMEDLILAEALLQRQTRRDARLPSAAAYPSPRILTGARAFTNHERR